MIPTSTLTEASLSLFAKLDEGGSECPVCCQHAQSYRRTITSTMARVLFGMIAWHENHGRDRWMHANRDVLKHLMSIGAVAPGSGDQAKLRFWGLIEAKSDNAVDGLPEKKSAGFWRVTDRGYDFAAGLITVPKHLTIYNNRVTGRGKEHVSIRQALATRFDYEKLMEDSGLSRRGVDHRQGALFR